MKITSSKSSPSEDDTDYYYKNNRQIRCSIIGNQKETQKLLYKCNKNHYKHKCIYETTMRKLVLEVYILLILHLMIQTTIFCKMYEILIINAVFQNNRALLIIFNLSKSSWQLVLVTLKL